MEANSGQRRMSSAKDKQIDGKTCFVIMPISDQANYAVGHFGRVYEYLIKPAITEAGYRPVRADEVRSSNLIHLDILSQLLKADLALCDLSSLNPNVMFELGIRQAFDKPVVLIKDDITRSPFDISPIRYAEYDASISYEGVMKGRDDLKAAIAETAEGSTTGEVNSIVRLLGLQAAALVQSDKEPEDARLSLIEQNLARISDQVEAVARNLTQPVVIGGALARLRKDFVPGQIEVIDSSTVVNRDGYRSVRAKGRLRKQGLEDPDDGSET